MRRYALPIALLVLALCLGATDARGQDSGDSSRLIPLPPPHKGLSFSVHWDTDLYDNLDGGASRGYATDSVLSLGFGLDSGALGAWPGGQFALGLQTITSTHPSRYVGDNQGLSNLEAPNQRQVNQFWYSQAFGQSLVRAGLMDLNSFFDTNDTASLFTNASFGITPTLTLDVPVATYPDPAWGVMARFGTPRKGWRVGLFQGNPEDRSSALKGGAMVVGERDWHPANEGGPQLGIGAWYRQAPADYGPPTSDWGAYANLEQSLPGHPDIRAFAQAGVSPGRVNTVPVYLGGGIRFHDVSAAISDLGFGFARAWIRDHTAETSLEATALVPLFGDSVALQPDVQYVFHPSGTYPNALAVALRLHLTFY